MRERDEILTDAVRELKSETTNAWPDDPNNTATALKERRYLSEPIGDDEAKRRMSALSRRNFLIGGAAGLIGIFGWRWMSDETRYKLLRSALEFNERVSRSLYSPNRLAPEFSPERITPERINGMLGLESAIDSDVIYVTVPGISESRQVSLAEIRRLPRTEMITELKCIEGWSIIVQWAGVRFSDLMQYLAPGKNISELRRYVSLATPDNQYFVGWDIESMMHPQTILAYEMNGKPLTVEHGAPLRLASPLKYGIKQLKRIGSIDLTNDRPKDYWANDGYDWYSGH
jgi:hypothetical protein